MKKSRLARSIRIPLDVLKTVEKVYAQVPATNCKGLCHDSCCKIGGMVSAGEAAIMTARSGKMPAVLTLDDLKNATLTCNYLTGDGRCMVYESRPLICRLYGSVAGMPCPHGCEPDGGRIPDETTKNLYDTLYECDSRNGLDIFRR